jgi:hypothetical protein
LPVAEDCDALDNDCSGTIDDNLTPPACNQTGVCAGTAQACLGASGWSGCDYAANSPFYEASETLCDGFDNDCDGTADVGCTCLDCHGQVQNTRRQITGGGGDFGGVGFTSHHVNDGTTNEIVDVWDCVLCHLEGDSDGTTNAIYHGGDSGSTVVNLRDVDDSANTSWTYDDPGVVITTPNTGVNCSTPNQRTMMTMFCLSCHDSDGLADTAFLSAVDFNDFVRVRTASDPFGDGNTVLDINSKFDPTNTSTHSISCIKSGGSWVLGLKLPLYYPSGIKCGAWNGHDCADPDAFDENTGWDQEDTTECGDCHMPSNPGTAENAHGSANTPYLLDDRDGSGTSMNGAASGSISNIVCMKCHNRHTYGYDGSETAYSRFTEHIRATHMDDTQNVFDIGCLNCHGGGNYGSIHGLESDIVFDDFSGSPYTPYRFTNGAGLDLIDNWTEGTVTVSCSSTTTANFFSSCNQHTTQGYTRGY